MSAKWEYFFEATQAVHPTNFSERFNQHLNARAAEGWELVSVEYNTTGGNSYAALIWRR
jgi:Domain of unknown function (DUF4177)